VHAVAIIDGDDEELLVALSAGRGEGLLTTHRLSLRSCLIVKLFNSITLLNVEPAGQHRNGLPKRESRFRIHTRDRVPPHRT
jgi:hypothetical protein